MLVVSTSVEVRLLCVSFGDQVQWNSLIKIPPFPRSQIKLSVTELSVPSDSVLAIKIIGLQSGLIYFLGSDGHIYQICYNVSICFDNRKLTTGYQKNAIKLVELCQGLCRL